MTVRKIDCKKKIATTKVVKMSEYKSSSSNDEISIAVQRQRDDDSQLVEREEDNSSSIIVVAHHSSSSSSIYCPSCEREYTLPSKRYDLLNECMHGVMNGRIKLDR